MYNSAELSKISTITNNIFLSGIFPLDENYRKIREMNIKYILSCVDRNLVAEVHDRILADNPNLTILYLPYNDDIGQNLWKINRDSRKIDNRGMYTAEINIIKYAGSTEDYNKILTQLNNYNNKTMIEIAYHFINNAVEEKANILVHCMAGISRSASLLIYFFMKKYNLNYVDAEKILRDRRPIVNPNPGFRAQLLSYQSKKEKFTENDAQNIINSLKTR